ncbi:MAG: UbiA family prenyltransferase [Oscillochloridaceae bacterium]|nr:UbiA family prenyltransferase [Chloroflexaceae bacterium]MDW8392399.1 UbiA family prenyltransferase [Oscillochloridaceae bacterium]
MPITSLLWDLYHFSRFSALGATAALPLLGAGSVTARLTLRRTAGLLAVATAFHLFAYLHNDVCDLDLDRTQPRRRHYPLVRGAVKPAVALGLAVACAPLAFALHTWLVAPDACTPARGDARLSLAAAFGALAIYNRWGKACPFPPLTDLAQALGWAALLRYGALATGHGPGALTRLLMAYEVLLILMVNGVHGALRDLENDAARGARTTALFLGARMENGRQRLSPALLAYTLTLQAALLALPLWYVASPSGERRGAGGVVNLALTTVFILARLARGGQAGDGAGMAHLVLVLSMPVALVAPRLAPLPRIALLAAHLLPLLPNGATYAALRWLLGMRHGE